mgnify:CR=1 FL=1
MNTIIINKIMMHMLDFEHRKIYLSEDFCELNDTTQEYYHKKVEKALYSPAIKELVVPSLHELLLRADKMLEDDEEFKKQAKEISEKFFALGSVIEEMPNSNILYVDCYRDGVHMIAALKLNYKYNSVSLVEEENVRITRRQVLPQIGTAVDEAIKYLIPAVECIVNDSVDMAMNKYNPKKAKKNKVKQEDKNNG